MYAQPSATGMKLAWSEATMSSTIPYHYNKFSCRFMSLNISLKVTQGHSKRMNAHDYSDTECHITENITVTGALYRNE